MCKLKLAQHLLVPALFVSAALFAQTPDSSSPPRQLHGRLEELSKRALAGDTRAQLEVGLAYEFGNGVGKDMDKAMHWYRSAADRGDPIAQADLGYFYETGADGSKDPAEAAKWYMRSALAGLARAKFNLGVLYLTGIGVARNESDAAHWIGEAAADGCPSALVSMSYMYANGIGVPRDPQKAADLGRKAAKTKKNDATLCMTLNPAVTATSVASATARTE